MPFGVHNYYVFTFFWVKIGRGSSGVSDNGRDDRHLLICAARCIRSKSGSEAIFHGSKYE